ncbi:MAG TPA: hypothetical protein VEV43_14895 [Actinomycetota bacterium]|nr:hypothetical protein [Actinomycetota bacterium]
MRRMSVVLLVAAMLVGATGAVADTRRWRDGNEARGPLDIARIAQGHRIGPKGVAQVVHTIRLHRAWPVKRLRHRGYVVVQFDRRGHPDGPNERMLRIFYKRGGLVATMYNSLGDPPKRLARVALWRPDRRTVKVAFPPKLLKRRGLERYEWNVMSFVEGRHDLCAKRHGCMDLAPNRENGRRYVRHVL